MPTRANWVASARALPGVAALMLIQPGSGADRAIDTEGRIKVETVVEGLAHPWGLAFLPDGRMLVTERPGRLRIVSSAGAISEPLSGIPEVYAVGQGGLLDVALDPDFTSNRRVYVAYSEPGGAGASTAVARGTLTDDCLKDVIFRQVPKVDGGAHFGGRLAFSPDGKLFITLGERFKFDPAQDLSTHLGKIVRINPDGSVPEDNPFLGQKDAQPEIWSYGHRNVQGAAIHPKTGELWVSEFGPMGGDELNIPKAGLNYGWPVVSWGRHYDGRPIPNPTTPPRICRCDRSLDSYDLAFRHDLLYRRRDPRLARQSADRRLVLAGHHSPDPGRGDGQGRGADSHGRAHSRHGAGAGWLHLCLDRRGRRQDPAAHTRKSAQMTREV